jgi:tryptophan synthase beta chain
MIEESKFYLKDTDVPKQWYNLSSDLKEPMSPPLNPGTKEPIGPDDLAPLFPMELIMQEVSQERYIDIPKPVLNAYMRWRSTPLVRARALEKILDTPARIYYKYEGASPSGSHKPNTAIAQAFYNKEAGVDKIATETGAGQWGTALAYAGSIFGLEIQIFMVKVSFDQKPYRKAIIESYGGNVVASPSNLTNSGKSILEKDPNNSGSLGIAISEAVEVAATSKDTNYALGSVLNHVLMHQSIIGQEAILQMEMANDYPDIIIGCTGGGSNFSGLCNPFLGKKFRGEQNVHAIAIEPSSCPSLTKGKFTYDFGDTLKSTPLMKMHTLGSDFMPSPTHSGGLRYHGMAPMLSHLVHHGHVEPRAYGQKECFEAGIQFARTEGIIPAPEATHAIKGAVDEALKCKQNGTSKAILFNLCGHGHFDMQAYNDYFSNNLAEDKFDENAFKESMAAIPPVN